MGIIENIKLYEETFRILKEAKNEKRLVLFVGAGASFDSGMPLWSDAIDTISKALGLPKGTDDALKIPQYYFNSGAKKEYNELMRKIFKYGEELNTTDLHKAIIGLGTHTIITTNYDHLIEKAAKENGEVMQVISQDIDLPYLRSGRQLIKIHGDFEHDNFVLKEDDYLQYSSNFKLIETYIKSIIGSKVVLFIGYSLNDPDVKHIFSWAKEILNQNFQRAYMILAKEEPNDIKKEYFKNLGINIIYASELVENKDCTHSEQIIQVINLINAKENVTETKIEKLYNQLKQLKDLYYVYGKYIRRAFYSCGIICNENNISLFNPNNDSKQNEFLDTLWNYFENDAISEDINGNQLKLIKQVIVKSQFSIITLGHKFSQKHLEIPNQKTNEIEELVINFDYKALHSIMENNQRNVALSNPEMCLQQAYICSVLGDYVLAYNYLKSASTGFYSSRNYVWYYIAMVNKKFVGKLLRDSYIGGLSQKERQTIISESNAIDLDKILNSIPNIDDSDYSFLKELGSFNVAYTLFYDVFKESVKVAEEANTNYTMYAGTAAYRKLQIAVKDYISYIYRNYIILDRYTELISIFVLYIRSILSSVNSMDIKPDPDEKIVVGNVRLDKIGKFELFIMIKYLSAKEIQKMFNEYSIKLLPVDKEGQEYIQHIFSSIILYSQYVRNEIGNEDVFWRYLEIVSHLELTAEFALKITERLYDIDVWNLFQNKNTIARFVMNVCNQELYNDSRICDAANHLIDKIIDSDSGYDWSSLLKGLSYFSYKGNKSYNDEFRISQLAKRPNIGLVIELYDKLGGNAQIVVKKVISQWHPQNSAWDYCKYCEAVFVDALEHNEQSENEIYDWIRNEMQNNQKATGIFLDSNYNYSDVINALTNLYLNNKIINHNELKHLIYESSEELSKWLIDMNGYDYTKFDCNWLETCSELLLEQISQNPIAVKGILKAYKSQFETKAISSEVTRIINKHFIIV